MLRIVNGKVVVSGGDARPQTYSNVQLRAKDVSMDSVIPFTFEAQTPGSGKIKLDGQAGPINRVDAAQTPLSATLNVNRMDLASTGFLDPASGLAGVLDFDGTLKSDGSTARTQGKLGQHCSLEPRIDTHLGPSSGDCRQRPGHRRTLGGGGGQVDEAGQRGRRRFVSREEFEPKWPTGIKRSADHTHR